MFLSVTPLSAIGEDYPSKPMMIISGFSPGGTTTITTQIFVDHAKKYFSKPQPILVNYKPGASQAIAASFVLSQPRDGYTLFWPDAAGLLAKIAKDAEQLSFTKEDFIFIGTFAALPYMILVNQEGPFKTLESFIDFARKNPGKLSYGSGGIASFTHLAGEIFQIQCGIKLNHVPFAGAAGYKTALLGGHIDCIIMASSDLGDNLNPGGGLRALAVLARERFREFPDVPTGVEKGYNLDRISFHALAMPKGTPEPVLEVLRKVFKKTADDPQVKEAVVRARCLPVNWDTEEIEKRNNEELQLAKDVFKKVGLLK